MTLINGISQCIHPLTPPTTASQYSTNKPANRAISNNAISILAEARKSNLFSFQMLRRVYSLNWNEAIVDFMIEGWAHSVNITSMKVNCMQIRADKSKTNAWPSHACNQNICKVAAIETVEAKLEMNMAIAIVGIANHKTT